MSTENRPEGQPQACEVHVPGRDYASPWCASCRMHVVDWDAALPPRLPVDHAELAALAEAATPGPWDADRLFIAHDHDEADAHFIAAARTAVPALLDKVGELTEARDRWRLRAKKAQAEVADLRSIVGTGNDLWTPVVRSKFIIHVPSSAAKGLRGPRAGAEPPRSDSGMRLRLPTLGRRRKTEGQEGEA